MVGDYLFVSKTSYGPRVPITPLSFPLVHHTLPVIGGKILSRMDTNTILQNVWMESYSLDQSPIEKVDRNDCVVFNYGPGKGRPIDKKRKLCKRCMAPSW